MSPVDIVLVVLLLVGLVLYADNRFPGFLSATNVTQILILALPLIVVTFGQTFALLVGYLDLSVAGMMIGTVSYMPPEQALGRAPEPRSDLYALGALLYELVTGRPPFLGDDAVAIISQHINTAPVAPTWHNAEVPRGLEALILRLLAKAPEQRPESAEAVRELLATIGTAPTTPGPPDRGVPAESNRPSVTHRITLRPAESPMVSSLVHSFVGGVSSELRCTRTRARCGR